MTRIKSRVCAALLAFALILSCTPTALAAEATATAVQLTKTEGTVAVSNSSGRAVSLIQKMRIYSGYHLNTKKASYAWLNLDRAKLCKLDAVSELEVRKNGKKLELLLNEGNLYFNVTEPLNDDESLNIRTSTMTVGIRGTCGWVKAVDQWTSHLYVLEGTVEVAVSDPVTGETKSETISAGEDAICKVYPQDQAGDKCEIIRDTYPEAEIDGFVLTEAVPDDGLCGRIFDDSGLDLRDYPGDPADRLRQDQASVEEKLAGIENQVDLQDNHVSTDSVWSAPEADPATNSRPQPPFDIGGSDGGWDEGGDVPQPDPPAPILQTITLPMPQDDDTVDGYLSQSTVSGVVLLPGTTRSSAADLLEVDSGITVPAGKTLTLQTGVSMSVLEGQTVQVAGALTVDGGYVDAAGTVSVSGQMAVGGDFGGNGTVAPSGGAVVRAKGFHLTIADGWRASETADSQGYHTLVKFQAGDARWEYNESTGTLRIYGTGSMLSIEGYGSGDGIPWSAHTGDITTVIIEDGITDIEWCAFSGCGKLASVSIPNSVTSIGPEAFRNCVSLTGVTIPNSVTSIGRQAFSGCTSLTNVTIPNSVTSINYEAFYGCSSLTSVTIPDQVTSIEKFMFAECTSLTDVTIPDSVTSIGSSVFMNCSSLTNVTIPDGVTSIGASVFNNCSSLTNMVIPDGITSVSMFMFRGCTGLMSVTIPESVSSIDESAFYGCSSLTSVAIPAGVTSIGGSAFCGCSGLTSVTIPDGVTSISKFAFSGCNGLTSVTIPGNVTSIGEHAFSGCNGLTSVTIPDGVTSISEYAFYDCSGLTSVTIPDGVTSISEHAFSGCDGLTSVTIPDGVTSINQHAFHDCNGLTSVTIPSSVTSIGDYAFHHCSHLTDVYYRGTQEQWNGIVIGTNNENLTNAVIYFVGANAYTVTFDANGGTVSPASMTTGADGTLASLPAPTLAGYTLDGWFTAAVGGTQVTTDTVFTEDAIVYAHWLQNYVTWRYDDAANTLYIEGLGPMESIEGYSSSSLPWSAHINDIEAVEIESGITSIGESAFDSCGNLKSVTIPDSVTSIGSKAFHLCTALTDVAIPDKAISIGNYAFQGCNGLTSVTIPNSVTSIGDGAFMRCGSLASVTIPDSVTSISGGLFAECTSLNNLVLPDNVDSIGEGAFSECKSLTSIAIPDGVTSLGLYTFLECSKLTDVKLPGSMVSLGEGVFRQCTSLTSVEIPGGMASIGQFAFQDCTALTSVTIPASVTSIEGGAFMGCDSLASVTISNGATSIFSGAFSSCTGLKSVTIPDSVTSVENGAFYGCTGLTDIYYRGTEEQWNGVNIGTDNGNLNSATATVHCMRGGTGISWHFNEGTKTLWIWGNDSMDSIDSIGSNPPWKAHNADIQTVNIESGVTKISNGAFKDCTSLTSVTIPDSVTDISGAVFQKCTSLRNIVIPESVTSIGGTAFDYCISLQSVEIPAGVTSINRYTFSQCSSLRSVTIPVSVTTILDSAFKSCGALTDVYYGGTEEQWSRVSIDTDNEDLKNATIHYGSSGPGALSLAGRSTRTVVSHASRSAASRSSAGYTDVPKDAWYAEAAEYCREHGLMAGTGADIFSPDDAMSRAMMVTVLHRLAGTPEAAAAAAFPDVKGGTWYAEAVSWASREKIILGYPDGTFRPDDPVTHEQVALIFQRYSGDPNVQTIGSDTPKSPATRAEVAAALMDFDAGQTLAPGTLSVFSAMDIMCGPNGIALDRDGSMLVTDVYNKQIWRVLHRDSESYAGGATVQDLYGQPMGGYNDAGLDSSYFKEPWAIAPFLDGWAVSDTANDVVRLIQPSGVQTLNGVTNEKLKVTELGVAFNHPTGLASDSDGNLYVADTFSGAVRKITPKGGVSTVASGLAEPMGLCWKDGELYIAETGANRIVKLQNGKVVRVAGSGEAALTDGTAKRAAFFGPQGVAVGADGSVYVGDTGNGAIRKIEDGEVTTLAARDMAQANFGLTAPVGLLVQGDRLYICDSFARKVFVLRIK